MNDTSKIKEVYRSKTDEEILVVPRNKIFPEGAFNGMRKVDLMEYESIIRNYGTFIWRSSAEVDPKFKQIIPYLVFNFGDKYFLMQRKATSSEARLSSKYSLGIGGHVRREDIENKSIIDWARREFEEEIDYDGKLEITPLGILNDESNAVGVVHTGFVFLLKGDSSNIKVREELSSGKLLTVKDCEMYYPQMETWSQYVYKTIMTI